jgi:predicted ester cyclase
MHSVQDGSMQGFDPRFRDFPDFIFSVSEEAREMRGLASTVGEFYHPDVISRAGDGIRLGREAVIAEGMADLACFPDQRWLGEDVIWSGTPQLGMLGSQRALVCASHRGDGPIGRATGRSVQYRIMADRYAKSNRIHEEWILRDTAALLNQLGLDPKEWAEQQVQDQADLAPFSPAHDEVGPYTGQGNDNQWAAALEDMMVQIMAGNLSVIAGQYDRACQLAYPGGEERRGRSEADAFWLSLRAALPRARFTIHHKIGSDVPLMPARAALRWSLSGKHEGWGAFGAPSGAELYVMGITHAEFGPWGVRREWSLFDAAAVWMQIAQSRSD